MGLKLCGPIILVDGTNFKLVISQSSYIPTNNPLQRSRKLARYLSPRNLFGDVSLLPHLPRETTESSTDRHERNHHHGPRNFCQGPEQR